MEDVELEPVDLSLPVLRELGAKWLVDMAAYIANNPDFIVKGFVRLGISRVLDGTESESDDSDYVSSESSEESSCSDESSCSSDDLHSEVDL